MSDQRIFQAYLISCCLTDKRYVGITARSLRQRWREHVNDSSRRARKPLSISIREYGEEAFRIEPIFFAFTYGDLLASERALIEQWGSLSPTGYNLSPGGQGCIGLKRSDQTRAKLAAGRIGKRHTAETRSRLSRMKIGVSQNRGEVNGSAKLTLDNVTEIKAELRNGAVQRQLARRFGVSVTTLWKIANGLKWAHVP